VGLSYLTMEEIPQIPTRTAPLRGNVIASPQVRSHIM
jgi:hypothetical protein